MKAVRTWKRDGTVNEMDLETAVQNLQSNGIGEVIRTNPTSIRKRLVSGRVLETRLATFTLTDGKDD